MGSKIMSVENENQNANENENQNDNTNVEDFEVVVEKFKDDQKFKDYITKVVGEHTKGIVTNRDDLLKENVRLKELTRKANQDEVTKLLLDGTPESKAKAIELLTADVVKPYQDLIAQKDEVIKTKEEFENKIKTENEQKFISDTYGKLTLNANIDEEAHKDILPVVYQNFKVVNDVLVYQGKDINAAGKPLSLQEFIIKHIENGRKYYLKDKTGSNALFKSSTDVTAPATTPNEESYEQYVARVKAENAAKKKNK